MIKKLKIFRRYDFDLEEQWINELANKGLYYVKKRQAIYFFERSDHCGRRYKVIPKKYNDFEDEEIQLFKDFDWEYLYEDEHTSAFRRKSFFYTDNEDAPELFTDKESYGDYLNRTPRYSIIGLAVSILIIMYLDGSILLDNPTSSGLIGLARESMTGEIVFLVSLGLAILYFAIELFSYLRSKKRILGPDTNRCKSDYSIRRVLIHISNVIAVAVILALAVCICNNPAEIKGEDVMAYNNPSPVLFRDFDPEMWEYVAGHLGEIPPKAENGIKFDYWLYDTTNLMLAEGSEEGLYPKEEIYTSGPDKAHNSLEYFSMTYDFRSEKEAKERILQEIAYWTGKQADSIRIDVPGADYAGYYKENSKTDPNYQYLYLRKGKRVVNVTYCGKQDIMDKLDLFTDQL